MSLPTDSDHYYRPLGDGLYQPTIHVQGAWSAKEQHMAPVSGLLTSALERHEPREELQLARISFDILGMIHAEPSLVRTRTLRPGRTIELIEATMSIAGRDVVRATAWRLSRQDTSAVAAVEDEPMPPPDTWPQTERMDIWPGGYIASVGFWADPDSRPGRARAWARTEHDLVEGTESSEFARYVGLVDTANGIAVRQPPGTWMFPNTDLALHFHRLPRGRWVGLDTTVSWGADGLGLTSTVLNDEHGVVGRAQQILTIRPPAG
jgi:hypothetical protein